MKLSSKQGGRFGPVAFSDPFLVEQCEMVGIWPSTSTHTSRLWSCLLVVELSEGGQRWYKAECDRL